MPLTAKNRADYLRNLANRLEGIGRSRGVDVVTGDPRALRECADALLEIEEKRHASAVALAERVYAPPRPEHGELSLHEQGQETRLTRLEQRATDLEVRLNRIRIALTAAH